MEYPNLLTVSTRQIFNWIKSNRWVLKKSDRLRNYYLKGSKRKNGFYRKFKDKFLLPIWVRPKNIDLRLDYGHWEADLIVGKRSSGFSNILTLVERKTRMSYATIVKSKNPMKINSALLKLIKQNKLDVKTITIDNGIEFEKIGILAYWIKCKIYFCEPYASYQRGSNENINGLIRRTFKKGTNFSEISENDLQQVMHKINSMPRKMFNWKSSIEVK